jgi:transposase
MLKIKRLCRERDEILHEKTAVSNRLHAKNHSYQPEKESLKRAEKLLKFLENQVKEIEKAIQATIEKDPEIKQKMEIICSIPGISIISAATIISETNGFALFKNKAQLVSYAGYDVVEVSSGTSVKKIPRISKKGNKHIRKILYFPALTATLHDAKMKNLYLRIFDKTKIKMKAYVAVQRKLLVLVYTLYKKNEVFNPDFKPNSPSLTKQAGTKSLPLVSKVK